MRAPGPGSEKPPDSSQYGRFLPGTVLVDRYRIIGLVGVGGMGEVYQAHDLKLGQTVALKFLPEELAKDPKRLESFHSEVRLARQISHPNVCRVYDIAEVHGHHFLSMEYIDGENLATLLRRIGRLPRDKGVEIARQLCLGLDAAHQRNVLHRDLKPANIMLDGRGHVRITDFGLARLSDAADETQTIAGTPMYMAPEQLAGEKLTVQSDIYSLGLVLFELFTGKRAFRPGPASDPFSRGRESTSRLPSNLVDDMDTVVERVILRCLETEPSARPASALTVAAGLPGGDPLLAALAAGETPSPDMIAASGESGSLAPRRAMFWLGCVLVGLMFSVHVQSSRRSLICAVKPAKPPAALVDRAQDILRQLGHYDPDNPPRDTAWGFLYDEDYLAHVRNTDQSKDRWLRLERNQPPAVYFWYRQSPRVLTPSAILPAHGFGFNRGMISPDDPPATVPGMVSLRLDPGGRLVELKVVRSGGALKAGAGRGATNWLAALDPSLLGFDLGRLESANDAGENSEKGMIRLTWRGRYPGDGPEIEVEALAENGRLIDFSVRVPEVPRSRRFAGLAQGVALFLLIELFVLAGSLLLATRNIRSGRADRRGALKVAFTILFVGMAGWILEANHRFDFFHEIHLFWFALAVSLQYGIRFWFYYVALEPYVRRLWPRILISWNRLLNGQFRDPMIGRHILVGCMCAVGFDCAYLILDLILVQWLGWVAPGAPYIFNAPDALLGARFALGELFRACTATLFLGLLLLLLFLLLRIVCRRQWLAIVAMFVVQSAAFQLGFTIGGGDTGGSALGALASIGVWCVFIALVLVMLMRFGLLPMLVFLFVRFMLISFPVTLDFGVWHSGLGIFVLVVVVALAGYGFYTSLAGHSLIRDPAFEVD